MLILEQCAESEAEIENASGNASIAPSIPTDSLFNNVYLNNLLWQYNNWCAGGELIKEEFLSVFLHTALVQKVETM